jgi:filamentous hemagglutinin family protein
MSYKNSPRNRSFRLSTPVRLGVVAVAACFISAPVLSLPVNPTVVNGAASFNQVGNVLTVTNSNGTIINWNKFSIGAGETTHFAQTSAASSVLNRVLNDPTAIYGTLSSNGRVWLVNPAGIMVGPGGKVDVAAFVASTLPVRNEDFLAGRHLFINDGTAQNVINQGEIKTPAGGSVYLIGSNVTNEGIITTPKGETILAAGATVSLIDSASPGVKVDITGSEGNATNLGTITAEAGRIGIAGVIVRNSGTLNASSVVSEGGRVFLKASQDAYVDGNGRIVTTGTKGGRVEVLGNRVAVTDNAEINASGVNGGGHILVGGDFQGKNPDIQNASVTYFGSDAKLKADAGKVGDGGTVIVWADDTTRAYGNISARGGASGGDGGFVEVSGKEHLTFRARVDTRAPHGRTGTLLLDPNNITIVADDSGSPSNGTYGGTPWQFTATGGESTVGWNTLVAALGSTDVNVTTTDGSITIGADKTYGSPNSLYLLAGGDINAVDRKVINTYGGGIGLVAGWNSSTGLGASATPYGGAGPGKINASGATFSTVGGSITLKARNNITVGSLITTGYDGGEGSSGGHAGDVYVKSNSGSINISTINAIGGRGGDDSFYGGNGGNGGSVHIEASSGQITVGTVKAYGGDGGDGGDGDGSYGYGGSIHLTTYNAGNSITLGWLDAGDGTIDVNAGGAILDGNGKTVNLKANTINLTSAYGGLSAGLAISADVDNSDGGVSTLNATVGNSASYGGISLRVAGDSPGYIEIEDMALSRNSVYFSATRDINIDGDQYFTAAHYGGIQLYAGRDVNWTSDADYTLDTDGSAIVSAGRNFWLDDYIYGNGGSQSSLTLVAGSTLTITGNGRISYGDWNDVQLIAGALINQGGSVNAGRDLDILAGTVHNSYGGELNAGRDLTIIAGNITGDGGEGGAHFGAGRDITALVAGDITLDNGAHFHAGNDVKLTFTGPGSTISLSNGGYVLANSVDTIKLFFDGRSSGGVLIDGVATTSSLPGESGFFVFDNDTPATEAAKTLVINYASTGGVDPCASSPDLCKPPLPVMDILDNGADPCASAPDSAQCKALKDEKEKAENDGFGDEDGKQNEKSSQKKVAQCSV